MKSLVNITISAPTSASLLGIIFLAYSATINVPINTGTAGKLGRENVSYNVPDTKPVPESSTTLSLLLFGVTEILIIKNRKKQLLVR
jgi:hypothetical protein